MYGWIWRTLPGPMPLRLLLVVGLIAGAVALLFTSVFPWAVTWLPGQDVVLEDG